MRTRHTDGAFESIEAAAAIAKEFGDRTTLAEILEVQGEAHRNELDSESALQSFEELRELAEVFQTVLQ